MRKTDSHGYAAPLDRTGMGGGGFAHYDVEGLGTPTAPHARRLEGALRRVLIIAHHNFTIDGMMGILSEHRDNGLISCVEPGTHTCRDRFREARPDVLLVHLPVMGDNPGEFIEGLLLLHPEVRILVFGEVSDDATRVRLVRAGAHGYLTGDMNGDHLVRAVEVVDRGGLWIERHILDRLFIEQRDTARFIGEAVGEKARKLRESLTVREAQILVLVMRGLSVKELAREVHLSEQGVKVHLSRLFARFDVHNRAQLILAVMKQLAPCGGLFDNIMQGLAPAAV